MVAEESVVCEGVEDVCNPTCRSRYPVLTRMICHAHAAFNNRLHVIIWRPRLRHTHWIYSKLAAQKTRTNYCKPLARS